MLIVPIVGQSMQEAYWMEVKHILGKNEQELDLLESMRELSRDRHYPDSLHVAMRDAIALIESLEKMNEGKIPHYEQESNHADQHYAIPLATFLTNREMKAYFGDAKEREENPEFSFRTLLASYIRTLYPADSMLPLGKDYDEFPFVIFRSLDLAEARRKMFTDKYLFMSHEFNILNMLLSSRE